MHTSDILFFLQHRKSDDFPEFVGFFSEEYRENLRIGYGVYFKEEIEDGSVKSFDEELRCRSSKASS